MSYDDITEISTGQDMRVSEHLRHSGVVVKPTMRKSVFTTADVVSINVIVRSTLGHDDLDGTIMGHLTSDNEVMRGNLCLIDPGTPHRI